jgi:hypothetical protein
MLSSCTEAIYGYRKKEKVNLAAAAENKKTEPVKQAKEEALNDEEEDLTAEATVPQSNVSGEAAAAISTPAAIPSEYRVPHSSKASFTQKATDKMLNKIYQKEQKSQNLAPASTDEQHFVQSMGGRWIIAGLILILVGALVGLFAQPFGWIISTVGGVILIIGLIFLLLELL